MPILDSMGQPVSVSTTRLSQAYNSRNTPLMSDTKGTPGFTLLSRFSNRQELNSSGHFKKLAADIEAANPALRSPLLNQSNFYMPESDTSSGEPNRLMNQWLAYYYKWSGIFGNCVDLHSCVESTLVVTEKGPKKIKDITKSDRVLSSSGVWQAVGWSEKHSFKGKMSKIKAVGCFEENFTYNHPIKIRESVRIPTRADSSRKEPTGPEMWVPADRVKVGDYLVFPRFTYVTNFGAIDLAKYLPLEKTNRNQIFYKVVCEGDKSFIRKLIGNYAPSDINRYVIINAELAELLGWYVAEGCVTGSKVYFSLNAKKDPVDRITYLIKKIFNVHVGRYDKSENSCNLVFSSTPISRFLTESCGKGADGKKIPDFVGLNTPLILYSFVKAYLAGDGCFRGFNTTSKDVQCCTVSSTLAVQLRTYCTKLGFLFRIRRGFTKRITSGKNIRTSKELFTLTVPPQDIFPVLYGKEISHANMPTRIKKDSFNFYVPVLSVSAYDFEGDVWDIKTEDHSFVASFVVHNSELPLSRFALRGVEDGEILNFYEQMLENLSLHEKCVDILKHYWLFGEAIPFLYWSDKYNCFTGMTLLDSNYVYVKGHYLLHSEEGEDVEFYELEPDIMLQTMVKSDDYVTKLLRQYLDADFIAAVRNNKRLLLSNFSTTMLKRRTRFGDLRGTAIGLRCLKSLLLMDKYKEANYSMADGHVNPKWIWKIGQAGDLGTGGYMPTNDDLKAFRDLLIQANNDPIFTIITHYAVNVEAVGLGGKLLPIVQELERLDNEILMAYFANKAVTTGEGPNFATASVAFRAMMSRYIPVRAMLERYLYQKLFAPVAYANKFFKRKEADLAHRVRTSEGANALIIPQIDWRSKANLLDDGTVKSIISTMVNSGRLPMKFLVDALDLDYDEARNYLYSEQATVFDPIAQKARGKMTDSVATSQDSSMLGQPYLPKTNSAVAVPPALPKGKQASKFSNLLTVKPIEGAKDPVQVAINKGIPTTEGPEIEDPMAKAEEIGEPRTFGPGDTVISKKVEPELIKKQFDTRKKVHQTVSIKAATDG